MSRKDKKLRVLKLTDEFIDLIYSKKDTEKFSADDIQRLFDIFCIEKKIDRPQDRGLRCNIVMTIDTALKDVKKSREENNAKTHKNTPSV